MQLALSRQRALHRSDPQPELLRSAQKIDADCAVDLVSVERAHEVADARHRFAVEGDDQVARQQTRLRGRPGLVNAEEPRPGGLLERESERDAAWNRERCSADPDIGSPHAPVPGDLTGDETRGVRSHGKADALRAHDHRSVDADHFARRGHQRAARIAGIEGSVGLHHILDHPAGARLQRASERRDDACGDRRVEAKRIADGDCDLAALELGAVAKLCGRQRDVSFDPEQRKIRVGIVAEHARLKVTAFERDEIDRPRALDDMAVGERETVGGNDDAGARAGATAVLAHVDAHDARADAVDDVADHPGIIVQKSGVARRRRNARTLVETVGVEGPNGRGRWGGFDDCGDMVTGAWACKPATVPSPRRPASDPLILPDLGKWPRYRPNLWRGSELESERRESLPRAARAKAECLYPTPRACLLSGLPTRRRRARLASARR